MRKDQIKILSEPYVFCGVFEMTLDMAGWGHDLFLFRSTGPCAFCSYKLRCSSSLTISFLLSLAWEERQWAR